MLMRRGLEPGCNRLSLCFPQSQDEVFIQLELLEGECWQEGGRCLAPFLHMLPGELSLWVHTIAQLPPLSHDLLQVPIPGKARATTQTPSNSVTSASGRAAQLISPRGFPSHQLGRGVCVCV